jgi:hypothetical protein
MLARRGYKNIAVFERLSKPPTPDSEEWGDPNRYLNTLMCTHDQLIIVEQYAEH